MSWRLRSAGVADATTSSTTQAVISVTQETILGAFSETVIIASKIG
jgi:hypothetical protein